MERVIARGRTGLRVEHVVAVLFISAGIHAALVPIHLADDPGLAVAFAAAAVLETGVGLLLARQPGRPLLGAAAALLAALVISYIAALVAHLPGTAETPEDPDVLGVVTKLIELSGMVAALVLAYSLPEGDLPSRPSRFAPLGVFAAILVLLLGHHHGHHGRHHHPGGQGQHAGPVS